MNIDFLGKRGDFQFYIVGCSLKIACLRECVSTQAERIENAGFRRAGEPWSLSTSGPFGY